MNPRKSARTQLLELAPNAPGSRVIGYLDGARPRDDVKPSDVTWVLRQSEALVCVIDGVEHIRADIASNGEATYPVADESGERAFDRRAVKTLVAGEPFDIVHRDDSRFANRQGIGLGGGEFA